jgi:hypothetical protein
MYIYKSDIMMMMTKTKTKTLKYILYVISFLFISECCIHPKEVTGYNGRRETTNMKEKKITQRKSRIFITRSTQCTVDFERSSKLDIQQNRPLFLDIQIRFVASSVRGTCCAKKVKISQATKETSAFGRFLWNKHKIYYRVLKLEFYTLDFFVPRLITHKRRRRRRRRS